MQVEVHPYGEFARLKGPMLMLSLAPGSTVRQAVQALGLPLEELGPVFVDGKYVKLEQRLHGGERVGLFSRNMSLVYIEVSYEAQAGGQLAYVPRAGGQEEPCR